MEKSELHKLIPLAQACREPLQSPAVKPTGSMTYQIENGAGWLPGLSKGGPQPQQEERPIAVLGVKPTGSMTYTIEKGAGWLPWLKK